MGFLGMRGKGLDLAVDGGRIQSPRQAYSDRHIRPKSQPDGIFEQVFQLFRRRFRRAVACKSGFHVPITAYIPLAHRIYRNLGPTTLRESLDIFKKSLRWNLVPGLDKLPDRRYVGPGSKTRQR